MKRKIKVVDSPMGTGKALKNGSKLITENGFINIEDSKVGDKIFCEDGRLHKILGVYPQGIKDMYKMTFNDGTYVFCSGDHLWTVSNPDWCTEKTFTTEELSQKKLYTETKARGRKWLIKIPMTKPLEFKEVETKIHPYVVGVLLGDGGLSGDSVCLTNSEKDIINSVDKLIGEEFSVLPKTKDEQNIEYTIVQKKRKSNERNKFKSYMEELGLMGCKSADKHIPHNYLFNSIENRIELLRGLIDTDGCVYKNHKIDYVSKSKRLIEDLQFLVESLGGTATFGIKIVEPYGEYYRLYICLPTSITPYSSKKNINKEFNQQQFEPYRKIRDIEKIEDCECTCISVDNPTKLFLTDHCIATHNTMAAIDYINQLDDDINVLFVTPFLTECERIIEGCPSSNFIQPSEEGFGTKGRHFKRLLRNNKNIVCTHALFSYVDDEVLDILRLSNYILILDEVLDVISGYDIYKHLEGEMTDEEKQKYTIQDTSSLIKKGFITIEDDYLVNWSQEEDAKLKYYENMKNLADRNLLYYVGDKVLFWSFPVEVFEEDIFDEVLLLTYLFEYQIQAYYYRFHQIPYEYYHVEQVNGKPKFIQTINFDHEKKWKESVRGLIDICESHNLNDIGRAYVGENNQEFYSALSMNWYRTNPDKYDKVERCIYNFLRKVPASKRMYTTFKEYDKDVKPKKVSAESFVPLNAKATNNYSNRTQCAYMVNRYMNPYIANLFKARNIEVDQDKFALSEMVQWVWRSAIRTNNPISLYIPSVRMRTLFKQWLNDEEVGYNPYQSEYFTLTRKRD